jgi:hypothetical protein
MVVLSRLAESLSTALKSARICLAFNMLAVTPFRKSLQLFKQSQSIPCDHLLSEQMSIFELQAQDSELAQKFELRIKPHKPRTPALVEDRVDGIDSKWPDPYKDI